MKVRITENANRHVIPWWYQKRIGEVYEVTPDEKYPLYYMTKDSIDDFGIGLRGHILKEDCEVVA